MKEIIFATHNKNKAREIERLCDNSVKIITLDEIGCTDDIPETATTLEGNALLKARYAYNKFGKACLADDTGLEVEVLGGEPGVYSARYAGLDGNAENNMQKLLTNMNGKENRQARFRTVLAYIDNGNELLFEGIVNGTITEDKRGTEGFGYDPIFAPEGCNGLTFAEIALDEKNKISHRGTAIKKFIEHISQK